MYLKIGTLRKIIVFKEHSIVIAILHCRQRTQQIQS